jgi:predicted nuclease of predicted toxin-antitoxin system
VRFLVDAQLPLRLVPLLPDLGNDALHTSSLPAGNRTADEEVAAVADQEGWIVVVTQDADFGNSHLLAGSPARVLVVATSNISNPDLLALFESRLDLIEEAFAAAGYVELRRSGVVSHPHPGL